MRTRSILTGLCGLTGIAALTATKPVARHEPGVGTVKEFRFKSKVYERTRRVWVYAPPNYPDACGDVCPLIVAFDGEEYLSDIPLPGILDSLIAAKRIPPSVALLIDDGETAERLADLANQPKLVIYVADELIPWLHSRWRVTRDPARTIITGSSAGGLAAAYLAFQKPDLFGNVLSQSGAFWRGNAGSNDAPYEWLTDQYKAGARKPIRFFLDVGALETRGAVGGAAPSILSTNQHLRDVLREKGYSVEYFEVPNGVHAPETWKARLPVGLSALAVTP